MRGSHDGGKHVLVAIGIIPAHAGLTQSPYYGDCLLQDHPRACGAHRRVRRTAESGSGSSPRMRGSPSFDASFSPARGIIPAHAGLTGTSWRTSTVWRDHPRACGAHAVIVDVQRGVWGSSPRMRGSRVTCMRSFIVLGIIPAHAGLT